MTFSLDDSALLATTIAGSGNPPSSSGSALFRMSDRMLARKVLALAGNEFMGGTDRRWRCGGSSNRPDEFFLVENQTEVRSIPAPSSFDSVFKEGYVASSADGQWIATTYGSTVRVWNAATRSIARSFAGGPPIAITADGSRVFSTSTTHLRLEQGFDVDTGAAIGVLDVARTGDLIAVGKANNAAEVRRIADGGVEHLLLDDRRPQRPHLGDRVSRGTYRWSPPAARTRRSGFGASPTECRYGRSPWAPR